MALYLPLHHLHSPTQSIAYPLFGKSSGDPVIKNIDKEAVTYG